MRLPLPRYAGSRIPPRREPRTSSGHQVKGANDTLEQLADARDKESWAAVNGLEKNLAFHLSGHILHSIYWQNMTGEGGGEPLAADGVGELADAIAESFGSFAGFRAQLSKAAATTQGSGCGVLAYEPLSGRLVVEQVYDHQGVGQGSVPILVFDAWEHAFYLQYRNQKVDFVEAMWRVVNWQDMARRYEAVRSSSDVLLLAP
ncbi:MAG: superoxide dismutase [Streptomyces sp.]|nr:superoxide dismutase [Streptomyces sp.]